MKKDHSKTARAVAVGCSALLGHVLQSKHIASVIGEQLRLKILILCLKLANHCVTLRYLYRLLLLKCRYRLSAAILQFRIRLTEKAMRCTLDALLAESPSYRIQLAAEFYDMAARLCWGRAIKDKLLDDAEFFECGFHSDMVAWPNDSSSPTATEKSPTTPDNPKI